MLQPFFLLNIMKTNVDIWRKLFKTGVERHRKLSDRWKEKTLGTAFVMSPTQPLFLATWDDVLPASIRTLGIQDGMYHHRAVTPDYKAITTLSVPGPRAKDVLLSLDLDVGHCLLLENINKQKSSVLLVSRAAQPWPHIFLPSLHMNIWVANLT